MNDWSAGYVSDIGYTFGYYTELNPMQLKLAFLNSGLAVPEVGVACDLGFGQGVSVNIHAAASITRWYGTDFNPTQTLHAKEMAEAAGSQACLYDDAFAEFLARDDLPEFDYIGLHGIWSWISRDNQATLVEFLQKKLKVGGVVYISYNTLPGWAAFAPIRRLMREHADIMAPRGHATVSRIDEAVAFAGKVMETNPLFLRANPQVGERLKKLDKQSRHYLAHEYFNLDWSPVHFADMAECLKPAKLTYACSAHLLDQVDALNLTPEQQAFLTEIPDEEFRQTTRDFMVNQQFRRDFWVKGPRTISALEQREALRALRFVLNVHRPSVELKVTGALGEASMNKEVYEPILDYLADNKIHTIAEMETSLQKHSVNFPQLIQSIVVLAGAGFVSLAQDGPVIEKARTHTRNLNEYIVNKARHSSDVAHLSSPVTGGGITVPRMSQLFILALAGGPKSAQECAAFAWKTLERQGQRLIKEGKQLESAQDNINELESQADSFLKTQYPVLKALQVV